MNDAGQISKSCLLCGLPMANTPKKYHPHCRKALANLKELMKSRSGSGEMAFRLKLIKDNVEWILNQPARTVEGTLGAAAQNAVLAFSVYLRRGE